MHPNLASSSCTQTMHPKSCMLLNILNRLAFPHQILDLFSFVYPREFQGLTGSISVTTWSTEAYWGPSRPVPVHRGLLMNRGLCRINLGMLGLRAIRPDFFYFMVYRHFCSLWNVGIRNKNKNKISVMSGIPWLSSKRKPILSHTKKQTIQNDRKFNSRHFDTK